MKVHRYTTIKLMASPWDDHAETIWVTSRTSATIETIYKSFRILKLIRS